jgi:tRNA pseudouridine55 synthase
MLKTSKKPINGILLLDKPLDVSSNKVLQKVKHLLNAKKAGHTGSLDPLATGMLPLCFGEATKFSQMLLDADKTYRVVATLGGTTATGDLESEMVAGGDIPALSAEYLLLLLKDFLGPIQQVPPMHSALKHQGQPLYKLARRGIEIEREARLVIIHRLELEAFTENSLTLLVTCSKGTYIRSLVRDIGIALGCGAHISFLRRLSVGQYKEEQMLPLEFLQTLIENQDDLQPYLLPSWSMLEAWPSIFLSPEETQNIRQGKILSLTTPLPAGSVKIMTQEKEFIGIGSIQNDGKLKSRRLLCTAG